MRAKNAHPGVPRQIPAPVLQLDYQTTHDLIKMTTDIRFRLLTIVPPLSALGIGLVSTGSFGVATPFGIAAVGALGFLVMHGVVLYDLRNSELYNALVHRAKVLERIMGFPRFGAEFAAATPPTVQLTASEAKAAETVPQTTPLPTPPRDPGGPRLQRAIYAVNFLGQGVNHGSALSLVYGTLLGAWMFPVTKGLLVLFDPDLQGLLKRYPDLSLLTDLSGGRGLATSVAALVAAGICAYAFGKAMAAADLGAMANALYWPSDRKPENEADPPWTGPYVLNAHKLLRDEVTMADSQAGSRHAGQQEEGRLIHGSGGEAAMPLSRPAARPKPLRRHDQSHEELLLILRGDHFR
jgi:hypothetical protein